MQYIVASFLLMLKMKGIEFKKAGEGRREAGENTSYRI